MQKQRSRFSELNKISKITFQKYNLEKMFPHHLQHLEILLKCVSNRHISTKYFYNISKSIKYLFVFKNITQCWNCNVAMKYFAIFDQNISIAMKYKRYSWHISAIFCAMWDVWRPKLYRSIAVGSVKLWLPPKNLWRNSFVCRRTTSSGILSTTFA